MNNKIYGRKIIRNHSNDAVARRILISWLICFVIGVLFGGFTVWTIASLPRYEVNEPNAVQIETPKTVVEPITEPVVETTVDSVEPVETTLALKDEIISLGEYKLTAYCSCEKCCGYWATIRPKDEDGNPIVYTANISVAKQGVTVAADTSILPFGTVLLIDGHEYIVQDVGGAIKGNRIDVYFENHEDALQFGVQYKEIFLKEDRWGDR